MRGYRVLICDVRNVVLKCDDRRGVRQLMALAGSPVKRGCLQVFEDPLWRKYGVGEATDEEVREHVRGRFTMAETVTDSQLDTAMASVFTPIQDTIELLERLREETHFRLVALTNSEPVRVRWHEEHGYRQLFDHYLVSCETRCAVPDPRMFKLALEAAEVQPEEVIFVGDVKKNVAAAQVFGFTAHVFQGAHAFRTFLHTQHVNA